MLLAIPSDLGSYVARLRLPLVEFFVLTFTGMLTYILKMHGILSSDCKLPSFVYCFLSYSDFLDDIVCI